jgi:hypothetical protein
MCPRLTFIAGGTQRDCPVDRRPQPPLGRLSESAWSTCSACSGPTQPRIEDRIAEGKIVLIP